LNKSFWEIQNETTFDYAIVGGGYTGLQTALLLQQKKPNAKLVLLERSVSGALASTKNAGFGCFGTAGEILDDLDQLSENECVDLIKRRFKGLQELRAFGKIFNIGLDESGGYEVFFETEQEWQTEVFSKLGYVNDVIAQATGVNSCLVKKGVSNLGMNFNPIALYNSMEFQIDPVKLHKELLQQCKKAGIEILLGVDVKHFERDETGDVLLTLSQDQIKSKNVVICTNALAPHLISGTDVQPARGQVLITKPIHNLKPKGNFHATKGYFYFRNVGNRILLGGGRHLRKSAEHTESEDVSPEIQMILKQVLSTKICPGMEIEIDSAWAGTMGVRTTKLPFIGVVEPHVYAAVGLGGMGIALSKQTAKELVDLL
jgi:gamma-glutamylputrescine oxidase